MIVKMKSDMKSDTKRIIDKWVSDYLMQCELMEIDSQRFKICQFLDAVVLYLGRPTYDRFNPITIDGSDYDTPEEMEQYFIDEIKHRFGYIITTFPLEIMHYYGYLYAGHGCFLTEELFGMSVDNLNESTSLKELYYGEFTPKIKDILINKLGVNILIK